MKKILFVLALIPSIALSSTHSEIIQKWDEITAPKGYILSVDLHNEKMCSKIWTSQIKQFKKK